MTSQFWKNNHLHTWKGFLFLNWPHVTFVVTSFLFTFEGGTTSSFYIIPAFQHPPSLHPSPIYSVTWQESRYFLWDGMSCCPLTTSNSTHAPPSLSAFAHCLLTMLQFTSNQRAVPPPLSFLLVLRAFPGMCLSGSGDAAHSQRFILFLHLYLFHGMP